MGRPSREEPGRPRRLVVGVISDTHGLLRPEAVVALAGVDVIIHAGDIGSPAVLAGLRRIAPVLAVRGNNDREAWAAALPEIVVTDVGTARVCVVHDSTELGLDPVRERIDVVISGHSHRPRVERRGRVLVLNPGSAGPRRFRLPVSVARLFVGPKAIRADIVEIGSSSPAAPGGRATKERGARLPAAVPTDRRTVGRRPEGLKDPKPRRGNPIDTR